MMMALAVETRGHGSWRFSPTFGLHFNPRW
jgi:hypothetical protein